jgi:thiamine biosynthesis lipoprotein
MDTTTINHTNIARRAVRALGTHVLLLLDAPDDLHAAEALDDAINELGRLELVFSRFDEHSELRLLERDRVRICSPELVEVIQLALDARRVTDGRFDPTIIAGLRAAGYDRSFELVAAAPEAAGAPVPGGGGVHVDSTTGLVALAGDTALDLGGIAKGWIVDRLVERLALQAPTLVDAGGDGACTLRSGGEPWPVDVEGLGVRIQLRSGAYATSGTDRRRWRDPSTAREHHHVIDPRTGASARTDVVRVTTIAATCATAEVAATALLIAGSRDADHVAESLDVPWLALLDDGRTLGTLEPS